MVNSSFKRQIIGMLVQNCLGFVLVSVRGVRALQQ